MFYDIAVDADDLANRSAAPAQDKVQKPDVSVCVTTDINDCFVVQLWKPTTWQVVQQPLPRTGFYKPDVSICNAAITTDINDCFVIQLWKPTTWQTVPQPLPKTRLRSYM